MDCGTDCHVLRVLALPLPLLGSSVQQRKLQTTLLLRNAARQHGELRSTSNSRWPGQIIVLALRSPHLLECAKRNKVDPPIHTGYFIQVEQDGDNTVNSLVMRSPISWNMVVPLHNTTLAYKFMRVPPSHFMMSWKEVSWTPLTGSVRRRQ